MTFHAFSWRLNGLRSTQDWILHDAKIYYSRKGICCVGWVIRAVVDALRMKECCRADREEGGGVVVDVKEGHLSVVLLQNLQIIAATRLLQNLPLPAAASRHLLLSIFHPGAAAEDLSAGAHTDLGLPSQGIMLK